MKKTIISITVAALCMSALSIPAFAADILSDENIYVTDGDLLAKSAAVVVEWKGEQVYVDPNTITPIYEARIMNYAETGIFDPEPKIAFDGQEYIANAVNEKGDYVGLIEFAVEGIHPGFRSYYPTTDESRRADYIPNAKRIKAAMVKQGIDTDCREIRFAFVHDVGYVYYIDNGESRYLAATGMFEVNGEVLNEENSGIIEIDHELKAYADSELAEAKRYEEEVSDNSDPNIPPPVGGSETPMYMADNTPYLDSAEAPPAPDNSDNPNTGGVSSLLAGGIALTACVIGISVAKKKKDQ